MKSVDELLKNATAKEIEVEVKLRFELRNEMVGQLYPSILLDEIRVLNSRMSDLLSDAKKKEIGSDK